MIVSNYSMLNERQSLRNKHFVDDISGLDITYLVSSLHLIPLFDFQMEEGPVLAVFDVEFDSNLCGKSKLIII